MKTALVQDLDPMAVPGGAQTTDRLLVREGFRRGHDIEIVLPETYRDSDYNADLVIFSNITRFGPAIKPRPSWKGKYAVFHHDFNFCRSRLYFPLREKCKNCVYLEGWRRLFGGAALNIFMSPLHRDAYFSVMPELSEVPHMLCPSLLRPDAWPRPERSRRPGTVLGLNCLLPYKGRSNVIRYAEEHADLAFTFAGAAEGEGMLPGNAEWIGPVDDMRLRELYGSTESFIHLPGTPQPCFDGGAKVLTGNGWLPIRQISAGMKVVSHSGNLNRVLKATSRSYAGPMTRVALVSRSTYQFREFLATPEHRLLTPSGWQTTSEIGAHVMGLGSICAGCGSVIPAFVKFCSRTCLGRSRIYNYRAAVDLGLELSPLQIGCLWGMIDGEGYIGYRKDWRVLRPLFHVTNTNRDILEKLREWTGFGTVRGGRRYEEKWKPVYRWHIERMDELYSLLKILEPYLVVKKMAAKKAIELLENRVFDMPTKSSLERPPFLITQVPVHPVTSQPRTRPKRVYNLEVENDQSYICEGIAAHNCERSAIEAKLSGCRMILNGLVGITSYGEWKLADAKFRAWLAGAPGRLWEALEAS